MSEQTEAVDIKKLIERSGLRVGTNVKTKFMKAFITKTTDEGLYMLDGDMTFEKIMTSAKFINRVGAENIIVCSGRQYAGIPIEKFCEMTGAKHHLGRFMPGTLTNPSLPYYIEPKIVFISDPEVDEQALIEATNAGIPVIGLANTENITSKLDIIIPANNRGRRALATMYWLLVRQILIEKGELKENESMKYEIEDFEAKHTEEEIE
ncbi:30S ribosomal protein S2 [Nitrosopumilus sp.]|jgi:small subunit ribosomal protein S2|nr:30S ribosomal protein S2 [Nitrosopumilus sp.]